MRWRDELTKHPLNTTVKQLSDLLERGVKVDDPAMEVERARFAKVVYLLKDALRRIDPDIAPFDILDQINSQLQLLELPQVARRIYAERDAVVFRDLNTRLTPALSYIATLRACSAQTEVSQADTKAATEAFERFSRRVEQRKQDFEKLIHDAEHKTVEAARVIQSYHEQIRSLGEHFQGQISGWAAEATATFNSQTMLFAEFQAKSKSDVADLVSEFKESASTQIGKLITEWDARARASKAALDDEIKSIIADAEEKRSKILKLYHLVAVDSVTGGHKQIADREFSSAQGWRRFSVFSVGLTIAWIIYSLFWMNPILEPDRVFWLQIGKTASLTALLLSLAVYASKQAALHRVNERRARSFFLQVQAFDPFIENLPETAKHELKQSLSARIFGPDDLEHDKVMLENGDFKALGKLLESVEQLKNLLAK